MIPTILRLTAVKARTGLSRSTIYLRISEARCPRPKSLGGRAVGWIGAENEGWLNHEVEAGRTVCVEQGGLKLNPPLNDAYRLASDCRSWETQRMHGADQLAGNQRWNVLSPSWLNQMRFAGGLV